jgi:hypothetical protein
MVVLPKSCSKAASVVVPDELLFMLNPLTNVGFWGQSSQ